MCVYNNIRLHVYLHICTYTGIILYREIRTDRQTKRERERERTRETEGERERERDTEHADHYFHRANTSFKKQTIQHC